MSAVSQSAVRATVVAIVAISAACTVRGTDVPQLTGPSETALAMEMTISPDSILHDGKAQATIVVTAYDASGKGKSGQSFRVDTQVQAPSGGWVLQDYGVLSLRTITTGSDGRASAVYTSPVPPPDVYTGFATGVRFVATPIGSNFVAANPRTAELQLVPPAGYQAPATHPTPSFFASPVPLFVNVPAIFNASASCPEAQADGEPCVSALTITGFIWDFGDGTGGSGYSTAHSFAAEGTYTVLLRVTNSRGLSALLSREIEVKASPEPTAEFTYTLSGGSVIVDATPSKAASGRTIVQYLWSFDGAAGSGITTSRFLGSGSHNVTLTVVDDTGQKGTKSVAVTVP